MKLMIAKIVYWTGLVSMVGVGIGAFATLGWFIITTIPLLLVIIGAFVVLIGLGMLFGWAENTIHNSEKYKVRR